MSKMFLLAALAALVHLACTGEQHADAEASQVKRLFREGYFVRDARVFQCYFVYTEPRITAIMTRVPCDAVAPMLRYEYTVDGLRRVSK